MAGSSLCDDGSGLISHGCLSLSILHEPNLRNIEPNIRTSSDFEISIRVLFKRILKSCCINEINEGSCSIDPYQLFLIVKQGGGFDFITKNQSWDSVSEDLGFGLQSGSFVKSIYIRYLDIIDRWSQEFYSGGGCSASFFNQNSLTDEQSFLSADLKQKIQGFIFELLDEKRNSSVSIDFKQGMFCEDLVCFMETGKLQTSLDVSIDGDGHNAFSESSTSEMDGCSQKRKYKSLLEMLSRIKRVAVGPYEGAELQIQEWWAQSLSAREVLLLRNQENSDAEPSPSLKRQKTHPAMHKKSPAADISAPERPNTRSAMRLSSQQSPHFTPPIPSLLVGSLKPSDSKIQRPQRSISLLKFSERSFPRKRVPVGLHFQATLPDWTALPDMDYLNDQRWLGTRAWPIEGQRTEHVEEIIGKGRPNSCSCDSPGSKECVRFHVAQERARLKSELGSVYLNWRFDNMGEQLSRTWTSEEQRSFKALVRLNPVSMDKSFWKPALKCFPLKNHGDIASYYFNVFVLRRMRVQTILANSVVDSDDDEGWGDEVEKAICPVSFRRRKSR